MGGFCGCQFSTVPNGPGLVCDKPTGHLGPHQAHGVTWPHLFSPTGGGDHDPRDQVGVDPTAPATAAGSAAGPPDLVRAIQAATLALGDRVWKMGSYDAARVAVDAAAPVLLQATRDRLADLEDLLRRSIRQTVTDEQARCVYCRRVVLAPHSHCWWCGLHQPEAAIPQHTADCRIAAALDGPAAQEEGG